MNLTESILGTMSLMFNEYELSPTVNSNAITLCNNVNNIINICEKG